MKQHEREYFISRVRSGKYFIEFRNKLITILTPTIDDEYYINRAYQQAYNESVDRGIKTQDQMLLWMMQKEFWNNENEQKIDGLKKDLERLKVEIFNARNNYQLKDKIRLYLRAGEKQLQKITQKKNKFFENTCEGLASIDRLHEFFNRCSFINDEKIEFDEYFIQEISNKYFSSILTEGQSRELARTEPWKSLWVLNDSNCYTLFYNKDRELSIDQKNLLIWSRMYENVQESLSCPSDDVIEDDDMLDGWFIIQRRKREQERGEAELEESTKNSKIANSSEVFIMAKTAKDAERINKMNDLTTQMVKKERFNTIKRKGNASQLDFQDERLKLQRQSNEQFKGKFRR